MKTYVQDVRERVQRVVDQGYPRAEIVKLLGVSPATIKRYSAAGRRQDAGGTARGH